MSTIHVLVAAKGACSAALLLHNGHAGKEKEDS
jgi:hypothetical protein